MSRRPTDPRNGRAIHPYVPELATALRRRAVGRREFLRTATLLGASAATAYAVAAALGRLPVPQAGATGETPRPGGTLRVSMPVEPLGDPAHWEEMSGPARWMLEYLTRPGPDNTTLPYLAESWEAADDLKTWTFHLRRDVRWSNGDRFIADDVLHSIRRWLDPATGSPNIGIFPALVEDGRMIPGAVEKLDAHTVRLHLRTPELAIPEALYNYSCAVVHRRFDEAGGNLLDFPVGTGPFAIQDYRVGAHCRLVRRPEPHWSGAVHLDAIRVVDHGAHPGAGLAALKSGQVDFVHDVDLSTVDTVAALPEMVLHQATTAQTAVARMRVDAPPFTDKRVRQAVLACMDPARILELALRGYGEAAEHHHVAPIHPEYAVLPPPRQDHGRARRLLAEAGHPDGLRLSLVVSQGQTWHLDAMQAFRQQCAPAGIDLELEVMPAQRYWDIWTDVPFGFTAWMHRPLGVQVLNLAYRSGVPWNESGYSNPEFDARLDTAMGLLDPDARRAQMEVLQATLQADAVIAQPLWRPVFVATSPRVRGYRIDPTLHHRIQGVWLAN